MCEHLGWFVFFGWVLGYCYCLFEEKSWEDTLWPLFLTRSDDEVYDLKGEEHFVMVRAGQHL